jgi:anti-sigma factor RsiW
MSEHLSQPLLTGYGERTLNADELLAVDRHLASCDVCYQRFTQISPGPQLTQQHHSKEEPFHLDYDLHLAAYVDGTLDDIDREIVESHVALCSDCAGELRDLQEFSRQNVPLTLESDRKANRWFFKQAYWPLNPQWTAAALILLLGVIAAIVVWTMLRTRSPAEQEARTSPSEVERQAAGTPPGPEKVVAQPSPQQQARPDQATSQPLIALNDGGGQITVDQTGHVNGLQSLPPDLRKNVERVLATREFQAPRSLVNLSTGSGTLRGGGSEQNTLLPLDPVGVVLETDRPTFRWRALADARDYVVTIYDSRLRSVQSSGPIAGTEWTIATPLERGVMYSWQISTVKDGKSIVAPKPPSPEARFRVLARNEATDLENAKRIHAGSHLAMGVLYLKYGLIDQAESELEALVRANPNSPVAAQLLTNLRSVRPR